MRSPGYLRRAIAGDRLAHARFLHLARTMREHGAREVAAFYLRAAAETRASIAAWKKELASWMPDGPSSAWTPDPWTVWSEKGERLFAGGYEAANRYAQEHGLSPLLVCRS